MGRWLVILGAIALSLPLIAGDVQRPISVNDIITLREYVDVRFSAQEKAVEAALAAADRANIKAENAADKRFEAVNEFRKTLSDETATFVTRSEYMSTHKALEEKVTDLMSRVSAAENRGAGSSQTWSYVLGALGFLGVVYTAYMQRSKPRR
jgi:hypothetical protein